MSAPTRRFIALHASQTGLDSPAAVLDWLGRQYPEGHAEFRVVEILIDPVTEKLCFGEVAQAREAGYVAGMEMERKLMRLRLGLAVPGDSNG